MPFADAEASFETALRRAGGDERTAKDAVSELASWMLRRSHRTGASLLSATSALADAAARAAAASDFPIEGVAQGYLLGVMLASERREIDLLAVAGHATGTMLRHARAAGVDVAGAARGAVAGALEWAARERLDAHVVADAVGRAAAEAADELDAATGGRVRAALSTPVAGVPVSLTPHAQAR